MSDSQNENRTEISFFIVDAFTTTAFEGNPAGVFLEENGFLTDEERRKLCAEVSLESAFVLPSETPDADLRLRYYTSEVEVPLCGHATVATMAALVSAGRLTVPSTVRVQTNVGILPVDLTHDADQLTITLHQNAPTFGPIFTAGEVATVADALGIAIEQIEQTGLPVQVVSTGTPEIYVPVVGREPVDTNAALHNQAALIELSRRYDAFGIYLFTVEPEGESVAIWSRCFDPIANLPEDPVTGSASGALGGYLAEHGIISVPTDGVVTVTARQGFAGKRGGTVQITVRRENNQWRPSITGTAVITLKGSGLRR